MNFPSTSLYYLVHQIQIRNKRRQVLFENLEVLILAGGKGTRLSTLFESLPKILAPIQGTPFIDYLLDKLKHSGFKNICFCTGVFRDKVFKHVIEITNYTSFNIRFSTEDSPLGTGGAVKKAIQTSKFKQFLILNGDTYIDADIGKMILNNKYLFTIGTTQLESQHKDCGIVLIDDQNTVIDFFEKTIFLKPSSSKPLLVNVGLYLTRKEILNFMPNSHQFSLERDLIPHLSRVSIVSNYTFERIDFLDIGTVESYSRATKKVKFINYP